MSVERWLEITRIMQRPIICSPELSRAIIEMQPLLPSGEGPLEWPASLVLEYIEKRAELEGIGERIKRVMDAMKPSPPITSPDAVPVPGSS